MTATRARRSETKGDSGAGSAPVGGTQLMWVLLLFVGSGCAALIYEVVWLQLLTLSVGSSAVSLGVVLGTFMGGMCIGSLLLPRYVSTRHHPLVVYAVLEVAIGVLGVLIYFAMPYAGGLYVAIGGPGFGGLMLRGLTAAICLLPPTILMGATLPAIARWVESTPRGVAWLGFFYGSNIAGAVFGCLLAGYYLLRVHDMLIATLAAFALNLAVAGAGYLLSRQTPYTARVADDTARSNRGWWPVYVSIGLSGMTALAAEVVWTRLLTLTLGATTYTFSLILAAVLMGLGVGSSIGAFVGRSVANPRAALAYCQLMVIVGIAWANWSLTAALPYWPINPAISSSPWFTFQIDLMRCLWVVSPAAVLWGASFPLALAGIGLRDRDPGRLVGTVYAANTVGAIFGSFIAAMFLIKWVGTQNAQRILVMLAAASALLLLAPVYGDDGKLRVGPRTLPWVFGILGLAAFLAVGINRTPELLIAYGRYSATRVGNHGEFIFWGEGTNSSMAVSRLSNGVLNYHNAGKVQASSEPQDMRLQRMLGHLATLIPENPSSVLVIGCGAGVTAGSVSIDPWVKRQVIAEIEPLVPDVVSKYFGDHNFNVVDNPKVEVKYDDARHYLLTTDEKFDAITSDPFDPWVKGAATLYTTEFFQVMKDHLNPGGAVTIFVQLYEAGTEAVRSEIATFFEVFPNGVVFGNTHEGGGYDVVLVGMKEDRPIDIDRIQARLSLPEYAPVRNSLAEIGFYSATSLFGTYAAQGPHLRGWLAGAQVNRDRNLRLQYLAGFGVNAYEQRSIYEGILANRQWPEGLFAGSQQTIQELAQAIMMAQ